MVYNYTGWWALWKIMLSWMRQDCCWFSLTLSHESIRWRPQETNNHTRQKTTTLVPRPTLKIYHHTCSGDGQKYIPRLNTYVLKMKPYYDSRVVGSVQYNSVYSTVRGETVMYTTAGTFTHLERYTPYSRSQRFCFYSLSLSLVDFENKKTCFFFLSWPVQMFMVYSRKEN